MTGRLNRQLGRISALLLGVAAILVASEAHGQAPGKTVDRDPQGNAYAAGELLVTYEAGVPDERLEEVSQGVGAQTEKEIPEINARLLFFPEVKNERAQQARQEALERIRETLEANPVIESADYNYLRKPVFTPDDPGFDGQYGLKKPRFPRAWNSSRGNGVKIGVIDSGIDQDHPDLSDKIADQRDFIGNDSTAEDTDGHGTHVAGTAAAITNNGGGVASACPDCRLLVAKALADGLGTDADIADGIVWAVDNGAEVVNLSLGGPGDSSTLENAVNYAWNNGAVVAAAAGNSSDNTKIYPAAYENAVAVAATNESDERASFSNYGNWVNISAPGVKILSTVPDGYAYYSGTSMSTPHVSGLAGLLAAKGLNNSQIRARMENTAVDLGPNGEDPYYGKGRIDALKAVGYEPGTKPAARSGNEWLLKYSLSGGSADITFAYGKASDTSFMGDWDGDGSKTPGIKRGNAFYLRNSNSEGPADIVFAYGKASDTPVVGDWDGDGRDTIGVRRGNAFYLRNSFSGGADILFAYGKTSDTPLAGDWNGNGRDTIGVRRGNAFYLRNSFSGGADILFAYGKASDTPVVGDWDNEGQDTAGVVRGEGWHLRNSFSGSTDILFRFGPSDARPLVWR